jgi:hypothetical protein
MSSQGCAPETIIIFLSCCVEESESIRLTANHDGHGIVIKDLLHEREREGDGDRETEGAAGAPSAFESVANCSVSSRSH